MSCEVDETGRVSGARYGGRFEPEFEVGAGGMGTVFKALDSQTGRPVALKVLHQRSGRQAERFGQEARLLAELSHPAIVGYVDHGLTPDGAWYLAMEWMEGVALEQRLAESGALSVMETAALAARLVDALALAHSRGVVHRDIKPDNIFLVQKRLSQAKILDFGIARRVASGRRLTQAGSTLGTPMYMSPEQARGVRDLDSRADLFSLGCVLFECLTGRPPFTGETPLAVLAKICLDHSVDIAAACPGLPVRFERLLSSMLCKDRAGRPSDTRALAQAFAELESHLAELGHSLDEEPRRPRVRTPSALSVADERRLFFVLMISLPARDARAAPAEASANDDAWVGLNRVAEPFGVRLSRLYNGSLLATFEGRGAQIEQTGNLARCALEIRNRLPRAAMALCATQMDSQNQHPVGRALERAGWLVVGADPGEIRLDHVSSQLLAPRFEIETARVHESDVARLQWEKSLREPPRKVLGAVMPFVGRDRELATLEALFDECAIDSVARGVVVTAPAGGGKSRLRYEWVERVRSRAPLARLLLARGDSVWASTPYALLKALLRSAAELGEAGTIESQRVQFCSQIGRALDRQASSSEAPTDAPSNRVVSFLAEIADLPLDAQENPSLQAARRDPKIRAEQMRLAWLEWIRAESSQGPVVLVVEDLHWVDARSVELLDAAQQHCEGLSLLVAGFGRPEIDDRFPLLWAQRDAERLALRPLTSGACQRLAASVIPDLTSERAAWIVARAEGNPFFLEELLRSIAVGQSLPSEGAPLTVLGVVQARLDLLGEEAKRILRAASLFGRQFPVAGVAALLGDEIPVDLTAWLRLLCDKEILIQRGGSADAYAFRHALIREAAYSSLTSSDKAAGKKVVERWQAASALESTANTG